MIEKTILFLDNTYPEPYQCSTLDEKSLGGTESSVIRTALILSKNFKVFVAQKYRNFSYSENHNLQFIPKSKIQNLNPHFVVILRKFHLLKELSNLFPKSSLYLWIHTYKNYEYVFKRPLLSKLNAKIICNSNTHRKDTERLLNSTLVASIFSIYLKKTPVSYCYNPIINPETVNFDKDKNKLLFFSSPNKGLDQVIEKFNKVRIKLPDLKLYIANPGYKNNNSDSCCKNIIYLGSLAHDEMMMHVRESLCVFYPQETFAETFGLIYAEANAHGTVVIADNIGSAKEILDNKNPPINVRNIELIIKTIKKWQKKYPEVSFNDKFSANKISNQWQKILL